MTDEDVQKYSWSMIYIQVGAGMTPLKAHAERCHFPLFSQSLLTAAGGSSFSCQVGMTELLLASVTKHKWAALATVILVQALGCYHHYKGGKCQQ